MNALNVVLGLAQLSIGSRQRRIGIMGANTQWYVLTARLLPDKSILNIWITVSALTREDAWTEALLEPGVTGVVKILHWSEFEESKYYEDT